MDVSRRSFLRGAFSVAAVAVSGIPAFPASYPILHGDAIHDDTDALNALFRGDPVICEGEVIQAGEYGVRFSGGHFLISRMLVAERFISIASIELDLSPDFADPYAIHIKNGCSISSGMIIYRPAAIDHRTTAIRIQGNTIPSGATSAIFLA